MEPADSRVILVSGLACLSHNSISSVAAGSHSASAWCAWARRCFLFAPRDLLQNHPPMFNVSGLGARS